jgi:hypothetical protein
VNAATSSLAAFIGAGNTQFDKNVTPATVDYRGEQAQLSRMTQTYVNANYATMAVDDGQNVWQLVGDAFSLGYTVDAGVIPETTREVTVYVECKVTGLNDVSNRIWLRYSAYENDTIVRKTTSFHYGKGHKENAVGGGYTHDTWNILTFTISDAYFLHNGEKGRTNDSDFLIGFWEGVPANDSQMLVRRVAVVPTEQASDADETETYYDFVQTKESNPYIDGYKTPAANDMTYGLNLNNNESVGSVDENVLTMTQGPVYFQLADPTAFGAEVQVKAYTSGENANVVLQYNSSDTTQPNSHYKGAARVVGDDVVTFTMTDAAFANNQNLKSSFRIYPNGAVITRIEVIAKNGADKEALTEAIAAAKKIEPSQVNLTLGDPSDVYGQGGNDALKDNNAFGFGDILKGVGKTLEEGETMLTIPFVGTGIDLYAMIDGTAGEIRVLLKDNTNKLIAARYIDAGFDRGTLYQTPVAQFKDLAYGDYTVELYVYPADNKFTGERCTLYLDGVRVYQPLGYDAIYGDEEKVQFISLRDILLADNTLEDNAGSTGVAFVANDEYKEYGPKAEVYLAQGQSLTFRVNGEYEGIQIGLHAANGVASKVLVNGEEIAVNSTMDMYYHIDKAANDVYVITNSGTSDTLISLTKLKLTGVTGTVSLDVTEQALSAAAAQVEQWQTEKLEMQNAAEAARQQLIQRLENKVSAYV